jgi:hydroxymethylbilane synthase
MIEKLKILEPQNEYVTKIIRTSGDDGDIQVMGAFTSAIQRALLDKRVDIAVHSYKDLPIEQVPGLVLGAISEREDVRDALLSKHGKTLRELPIGAIVGTGSLRRQIQLQQIRPDLEIKFIQGNLDSRIKKMQEGDYHAIILAVAGLKRLGMLDQVTEFLTQEEMIPAVCQGALALEIRDGDKGTAALVKKLNNEDVLLETDAERSFLTALGGGCNFPMAAYAKIDGSSIKINGLYASADGSIVEVDSIEGHKNGATRLASQLAINLMERVRTRKFQAESTSNEAT